MVSRWLPWLLVAMALAMPVARGERVVDGRPNVLLICVDDLKPALGCYGDTAAKTPNIDRLAARGVRFDLAFTNQAVCSPSRNALLLGLRPQSLGIYDLATNFRRAVPAIRTLPQLFADAGWRTASLGKVFHIGHGNRGDETGWDEPPFRGRTVHYALPENDRPSREAARFDNRDDAEKLPRGSATERADVADDTYDDGRIATEAARRLRAAAAAPETPFFLAVGFFKPHLPFVAPERYWRLHDPDALPRPRRSTAPDGAPPYAAATWGELRQYKDIPDQGPLDDAVARRLVHGYYAATSYADAQIGRVLDALDETGLAANTIVVLWGDHGWHLGDHGQWCKHSNYEQAARIPLVISAPGVTRAASRTAALAETVDLYPTLCELAGLPVPSGLDGRSLVPVLKDPAADTKEAVFHFYPRNALMGRAVRTADHRLVEWKKPGAPSSEAVLELYDYKADPAETRNLAATQPDTVARLRAILARQPEAKPQFSAKAPAAGKKPAAPAKDRGAMFDKRDANKDGKLTREEFLKGQPDPEEAPKRFPLFDKDGDGTLSRDEFIAGGR